uniref:Uncharacterized protein n=1 Tax=Echeneis naucrates TaxID=173247 RepID=A0A665VGY7_ECHNA
MVTSGNAQQCIPLKYPVNDFRGCPSIPINSSGPLTQLHFYVDECYEQWKCLERERKMTETILTKTFPGKRITAVSNTTLPKTPPNPTRVDHLIVKLMREQAKVTSLLHRMECLRNIPLHINIHTALSRHHMSLCITQARRKEELANKSKHQQQRDIAPLIIALKDLAAATRKLQTELWCALQMTLPKPVKSSAQVGSNCKATQRSSERSLVS